MVRSDKQLDSSFVNSEAWSSDEVSGKTGDKVDRYRLPEGMQARMSFSGSERNSVFLKSNSGTFVNVSGNTGLDSKSDGRSVGIIDIDKDGRNDFLITNSNKPTLNVYHNQVGTVRGKNNFIAVRIVGGNHTNESSSKSSNRDGIGSLITISHGDQKQIREVRCGEGLATQNSRTQIIGLGLNETASQISIRFPSGKEVQATDIATGNLVTFHESGENDFEVEPYSQSVVRMSEQSVTTSNTASPIDIPAEDDNRYQIIMSMATWCESCRSHLPELELINDTLADSAELVAVPIDVEDTTDKLAKYIQKYSPAYRLSPIKPAEVSQFTEFVASELGSATVPFSIIVSPTGEVVKTMQGIPSVSDIKKIIGSGSLREK